MERSLLSRRTDRRFMLKALGLLGLTFVFFCDVAWSKDIYPAKPIVWVVPYQPGGGSDITARAISPFMEKEIKKISPNAKGGNVLIKNVPAGGGEKGISDLYNAAPDGYTIGGFSGAFLAEKYLFQKTYDTTKLTYLVRTDDMSNLLVTSKSGPKNWNELVAASKIRPIKWAVGMFGRGLHVTSIIINEALRLSAKLIPFGGNADSINAVMRGDVQLMTIANDAAKSLIDAGEIKVLVTLDKKIAYPGAVSIQDLGHPELVNLTKAHRFLAGPPGLPKEIEQTIVKAFQAACKNEEFLDWNKKSGFELSPLYDKDLENLVKEIMDFYKQKAPVIKQYL